MNTSESITKLAAALVAAQAEMPGVPKATKGQVGNQVRYYADLATVLDAARPVLAKHGLGFVQAPVDTDRGVAVTTRLVHESGEWMESTATMPSGGNGAQGIGSAITYARRYSLMAWLGLAAEDDDGAAASKPAPAPPQRDPNAATQAQLGALAAAFDAAGIADRDARLAFAADLVGRDLASSKDLTKREASAVIDHLKGLAAPEEPQP